MDRRSWLPEDLRAYHRGLLLRLLGEEGPLTRRDLAQRSGLSIPTAASIVSNLLASGQIVETAPWSDRIAPRGPRAGLLALARHAHLVVGMDICANRLRAGLCDLSGVVSEVVKEVAQRAELRRRLVRPAGWLRCVGYGGNGGSIGGVSAGGFRQVAGAAAAGAGAVDLVGASECCHGALAGAGAGGARVPARGRGAAGAAGSARCLRAR